MYCAVHYKDILKQMWRDGAAFTGGCITGGTSPEALNENRSAFCRNAMAKAIRELCMAQHIPVSDYEVEYDASPDSPPLPPPYVSTATLPSFRLCLVVPDASTSGTLLSSLVYGIAADRLSELRLVRNGGRTSFELIDADGCFLSITVPFFERYALLLDVDGYIGKLSAVVDGGTCSGSGYVNRAGLATQFSPYLLAPST